MSISTFEQDAGSIRDQLMECCSGDNIENAVIALSDIVAGLQHARQSKGSAEQHTDNSDYTAALIEIFCWLNGESGEFPTRKPGDGAYWWRSEMAKRLNAAKARHCA
jgi:hypothetical protein